MDSRANQVSIKRFVWVLVGFIQNKRALHSLLPLLPKRILIKLLVVRFVTIVTRMIATVQGLLCNGLRAPVLINGLAPFGIWLVVAIGFALASYISTASTPNTTYPAPSRQNPASGSSAWAPDGPSAALREARPAPWSADPSAAHRRHPASNPAAPPSASSGRLEVIVAVVRVRHSHLCSYGNHNHNNRSNLRSRNMGLAGRSNRPDWHPCPGPWQEAAFEEAHSSSNHHTWERRAQGCLTWKGSPRRDSWSPAPTLTKHTCLSYSGCSEGLKTHKPCPNTHTCGSLHYYDSISYIWPSVQVRDARYWIFFNSFWPIPIYFLLFGNTTKPLLCRNIFNFG